MAQAVKLADGMEDKIDVFAIDAEPGFHVVDRLGLTLFVPQLKPLA
jgi:hypothetical protein